MSNNLALRLTVAFNSFERIFADFFRHGGFPPPAVLVSTQNGPVPVGDWSSLTKQTNEGGSKYSLKDLIGDGIFWAVPKHRRTIEKRLRRKFGHTDYVWKMLKIKTHLRSCSQCGHDHEVGVLCPHCYDKVRQETKLMQEKIQEDLGLQAVEQDVVVLYEGERKQQSPEVLNGKRIVEMAKPRPMWFTKNLLQKTTQQPADTKEVKPSNLG